MLENKNSFVIGKTCKKSDILVPHITLQKKTLLQATIFGPVSYTSTGTEKVVFNFSVILHLNISPYSCFSHNFT